MVIGTLGYSSGLLQTVEDILGTNRDSKGLLESPQNSFGLLVIHEIADFLGELHGTPGTPGDSLELHETLYDFMGFLETPGDAWGSSGYSLGLLKSP